VNPRRRIQAAAWLVLVIVLTLGRVGPLHALDPTGLPAATDVISRLANEADAVSSTALKETEQRSGDQRGPFAQGGLPPAAVAFVASFAVALTLISADHVAVLRAAARTTRGPPRLT